MNATVSEFLLHRLKSLHVEHIFGIPGDFILPFFETLAGSEVSHVATCNELNAGYAADGYARIKGMGCAAVTYGPGSFSIINAVAGAFAESVPVVIVSGGPATRAYRERPVLHHLLFDRYETSVCIFEKITAWAGLVDQPEQAAIQIDTALATCLAEKSPVYLEIPADIQRAVIDVPDAPDFSGFVRTDREAARNAARTLAQRVLQGKRTVVLPGHEIHRWGLQDKLVKLLEITKLPAASVFIGKADYLEHLPNCIGSYQGAGSRREVRDYVEQADTVIFLGMVPSDFNLGGFTANLSPQQTVTIWNRQVKMAQGNYTNVSIADVVDELLERLPECVNDPAEDAPLHCFSHVPDTGYRPETGKPLTNKRFYDRLANFLQPGDIVLADAGCAINMTHLQLPPDAVYIASCYWASIGMGFAASLGAVFAARPDQRVIAVEGDGSFQMTAQELSSMSRYKKSPVIFLVNNRGYTAERLIHDGPFNDIAPWKYHRLPEVFGGGEGIDVHTENELEAALDKAASYRGPGPLLIEVHVDPYDASEAFRLMSEVLRSH